MDDVIEEDIAKGLLIRSYDKEGNELLKFNEKHPEYKQKVSELEEKKSALGPERRNVFEALQDENRGEHQMNEFAAMHTTERLSDKEVSELQPRLRRIRRGLEL